MRMSRSSRPLAGPAHRRVRTPSALTFSLAVIAGLTSCSRPAPAQGTLNDPAFEDVRRASVLWDRRTGPERRVVDMVCLVPDVPTFLEAVAAWDQHHYFPVLIDDVETTFKFLRAFRPARVVRYPSRVDPAPREALWDRAVAAVGLSWTEDATPRDQVPRGDAVLPMIGPVPPPPPGVVVSSPGSPSLAGAVALAAGRFQPLLRWEPAKTYADELKKEEALELTVSLERLVAGLIGRYDHLGDDCDFVTLAGNYPYRYLLDGNRQAIDDLLCRTGTNAHRWAYTGRLTGDPAQSVYRAMCSLFLHPDDALLVNTYGEKDRPWTEYGMTSAAALINRVMPATHVSGERASLSGWHQSFDPVNRHGLLLINTRGGPTQFAVLGGPLGQTADIPETVPTAAVIIHSFSAEKPDDPETLAGRWLANGAFVYFGSMNEPSLQGFRPPSLVASFLSENLPVVTAVRKSLPEIFGQPWRLVYFGDPLFRIRPVGQKRPRVAEWSRVGDWPAYPEFKVPGDGEPEDRRLKWAIQTAVCRQQAAVVAHQKVDIPAYLLGLSRDRLDPTLRPVYDAMLADNLLHANRVGELIERLAAVPVSERSPSLRRHLETAQMVALQRALDVRDMRQAIALWTDVVKAPGSREFVKTFTDRVGTLADGPVRQGDWRSRLKASLRAGADPSNVAVIEAELKAVDQKLGAAGARR
jgi:hypothetical protein